MLKTPAYPPISRFAAPAITLIPILTIREKLELGVVWVLLRLLGWLPRGVARTIGAWIGSGAFVLLSRLRHVGRQNLRIAFPEMSENDQNRLLKSEYRNLGWLLAEFCQMPRYRRDSASKFVRYEGLENYLAAKEAGKGVFVLTGHLGAWELSSFYHSLMGYPMSMVIRRLDNSGVDELVNRIRCMHGNRVLHKDDFARGLLAAMRRGETVGILMDTNMTPPQGEFVDFFGRLACTASGMARVALKTGAAVLPGFLLWEEAEQKYVLHFGKALELVRTDSPENDIIANTALFAKVTEEYIRRYPGQWLWVHRRWKTRPEGEPPIYTS